MSDAILDAALTLFIEQGYAGTSMRAIARGAGQRSVAGLYNHFENKQAIMQALMMRHSPYDAFREALQAALNVEAQARYHTLIKTLLLLAVEHYDFLQLVQIDARELEGQTLQNVVATANLEPDVLAAVGEIAHTDGVRPIQPIVLVRLLATLALGFVTTNHLAPTAAFATLTPEEWADTFATLVTYGLYTSS